MAIKEEFIHTFGGFSGCQSRCHIRILDDQDNPLVILCSQLANKPGTSVTNSAELIALNVKNYLAHDNLTLTAAIHRYIKSSRLSKILDDLVSKLKETKNLTIFALESLKLALEYRERYIERTGKINGLIWVEHYVKGIGLVPKGSYSIVTFEPGTWTPSWKHLSLEKLSEITGYNALEFQVPLTTLKS